MIYVECKPDELLVRQVTNLTNAASPRLLELGRSLTA
jgi:hypothetical protein